MKVEIATSGHVHVTEETVSVGDDGKPAATGRSWSAPPEQAEKHLDTWGATNRASYMDAGKLVTAAPIAAGDASAIADAANEARKQRES